jgi:zinc transporter ZupT
LGLVSHRIPEGLFLGTLLLPRFGNRGAAAATMLVAASTAIGAISGERLLAHADSHLLHAIIALGMGAMLRVAFHRHSGLFHKGDFALGALGFLFGATLAIVIPVTKDVESRGKTVRAEH